MVFDDIKNLDTYKSLSNRIATGLEYLKNTDFSKLEKGRYEIDGENLYAIVNVYNTVSRELGKWECHRKYIDIQFLVDGIEQIGFADIKNMTVIKDYDPVKDLEILKGEGNYLVLPKNYFAIFFPQDAHQPNLIANDASLEVKKVVIKVKVDE